MARTPERGIISKKGVSGTRARVDVSEIVDWQQRLQAAAAEIELAARRTEDSEARKLAEDARRRAPAGSGRRSKASVDYGPLRSKISADSNKVSIGTAFYGAFLEFGTKRGIAPRPFMGPATRKARKSFREAAIKEAMRVLGH